MTTFALSSLSKDLVSLSSVDYEATEEVIKVLIPFHQATVELSKENLVSGSADISLMKMLHYTALYPHLYQH